MPLRITVLCHETPFPPNHGGRVDMWRRLLMMSRMGVQLQIISWDYGILDSERAAAIDRISLQHIYIPLKRSIAFRVRRIPLMLRYPWFASVRWPLAHLASITRSVSDFGPNILFLDGWHGGLLALYLQKRLDIPLYYRSHNIEHIYIKAQHEFARTLRTRIVTYIADVHLKKFEFSLVNRAKKVYDISVADMRYWELMGYTKFDYLPPLFDPDQSDSSSVTEPSYDLVFLGNLNAPNNVLGIRWLLDEVMPIVWRERPSTSLLIAGSHPIPRITEQLATLEQVTLLPNPVDATSVLLSGRICINPVQTASGIQIKNIDMLLTGRPIITIGSSLSGFPDDICSCFIVADNALEFSGAILRTLESASSDLCNKDLLDSYFGKDRVMQLLQDMGT